MDLLILDAVVTRSCMHEYSSNIAPFPLARHNVSYGLDTSAKDR